MYDALFDDLTEFFSKKPSAAQTFVDILLFPVPIWLSVMFGLLIGCSWRHWRTGLVLRRLRSKFGLLWTPPPPGFGARRLWLSLMALSPFSVYRFIWSNFVGKNGKLAAAGYLVPARNAGEGRGDVRTCNEPKEEDIVTENDLEHLLHLLMEKDRHMKKQFMMERSTPNIAYQAWRYEPQTGPTIFRSRTVFEDATPELVRDFFWDSEFRSKWDTMLAYFKILEEHSHTGIMISHWIKKFPFFCSDREYIVGRRIWEAGNAYYCVTKGVPYPGLPKHDKPRRVELYFSSWVIKAVESRKGDGQMSACEVTLLHYEDMGIPKDVARLGVRHGMWGAIKQLHSGMKAYQNARKSGDSLSRCALMARITTKFSFEESIDPSEPVLCEEDRGHSLDMKRQNDHGVDWKWMVIGGTVALVCFLHSGALGKALLLGAGQRIARR